MALELRQQLKLTQQLIMTPQLQQAIKLLQLSRLELIHTIKQEMETNPVLEYEEPFYSLTTLDEYENKAEEKKLEALAEFWEQYSEDSYLKEMGLHQREEKEELPWENIVSKSPSLYNHLMWQLNLSHFTEKEKKIGGYIIGNLDDDGYLKVSLKEIATHTNTSIEEVKKVLKRIQEFDPVGVAARDLKECLLLQIEHFKIDLPWVREIVQEYLSYLGKKDLKGLAKRLKAPLEEIKRAVEVILSLEPKPGRQYNTEVPIYIVPDVYVYKVEDDFVVVLNEDGLPKLHINDYYRRLMVNGNLSERVKNFLQSKFKSAVWLIKSIHQRQRTLYRVACSIFKFQREFLEKGIEYLRPLVLKDVADDIGLHESTVSRVTANKYVQTPYGIFELKFFFNTGINTNSGNLLSAESIKAKIREIIASEDPQKPYSDQKIAKILKEQGINIARRTVAKYRESLGILPSSQRKRLW